ncbi:UNVERIFIED_CONTAM: hypothetical protein NCL1_29820 [Trichonephila clavipes]
MVPLTNKHHILCILFFTAHFPVVKLKRLTPDEIKNAVEVKEKPKERSPPRSEDIVGVCNIPRPTTSVIHHGSGSPLKTSPDSMYDYDKTVF